MARGKGATLRRFHAERPAELDELAAVPYPVPTAQPGGARWPGCTRTSVICRPGCPTDPDRVTEVFTPLTQELSVTHIDSDPTLPDYGDSGMVLLTGVAR